MRARGDPYTTRKGQLMRRERESNCNCKYRCHDRIQVQDVETVQSMFNGFGTKRLQDTYIAGCIKSQPIKRQRPSTGERTNRGYANSYHVKIGVHRHRVCQKAFAAIHSITLRRVALIAKKSALELTLEDQRGKNLKRPNKIPVEVVQRVHNQIKKFPTEPSHYSRAHNQEVDYLPANLTLKTMHDLYTAENPNYGISYDLYCRYFAENINLRFRKPKSDTCKTCDVIATKLKSITLSPEERTTLIQEKNDHQDLAASFFQDLKDKFLISKEQMGVEAICYDYQQNLPLPKVPSGDAFYMRQLWLYNFGKKGNHSFYMYDEVTGRKTPNEPVSFLDQHINTAIDPEVRELNIFSDNCVAQNKNYTMMEFLFQLIHKGRFDKIVQRFPEPGHSFMPCDRAFGIVEKEIRKNDRIYLPADYFRIISKTSSKFKVIPSSQDKIFNMVDGLKRSFGKHPVIIGTKRKFLVTKPRVFVYEMGQDGTPTVKAGETLDTMEDVDMHQNGTIETDFERAYNAPLHLKRPKYQDVMNLAQNYVAKSEIEYYEKLTCEE